MLISPAPHSVDRPARLHSVSLAILAAYLLAATSVNAQTTAPAQTPATQAPVTTATPAKPDDKTAAKPAQPVQGAADAPTDPTVVTITAAPKSEVQHKVDRDIYDVKQDPQASTGSAADILNNVPAVTVDSDGSVALRGNSNVQVYVNGKKSAQMQGDNRAFTLQSLAADDIDTVEVMTNPSAAFGSDSAGGIINIVMKRGRNLKPQTTLNAVAGDQGRGMVNFRTGKTFDKLTINGGINVAENMSGGGGGGGGGGGFAGARKNRSINDRTRLDPLTGAVVRRDVSNTVSKSNSDSLSGNLNANYNLSDSDTIESALDYRKGNQTSMRAQETVSYNGANVVTSDRGSLFDGDRTNESLNFSIGYNHLGPIGTTASFKTQYSHSQNVSSNVTLVRNIQHQPASANTYYAQAGKSKDFVDTFTGDWSNPILDSEEETRQLQLGWNIQHTVSDQYNYQSLTLTTPVTPPQSPRTSSVTQFDLDEMLSAVYAVFERKRGKFGFNAGLRIENLHQELLFSNPTTTVPAAEVVRDSVNYSPSLFLSYDLTDKNRLKFAFSQKIQRPQPNQLNPLIIYSEDGLYARSGNSSLKPERTDKYELNYYRDGKVTNFSGQLFYDSTTGFINTVSTFLAGQPDVLLTTTENSGTRQRSGTTLTWSANTPDRKFSINMNGNYAYVVSHYNDRTTGLPVETKGPTSNVRVRFQYRPDQKNNYSANVQYQGKQTRTESYTTPSTRLNLSYQRQLMPNGKMALNVNASGILIGDTSQTFTNNSVTRGYSETFDPGASFMVSLRYMFGQVQQGRGQGGFRGGQGGQNGGQGGFGGGQGGGGGFGGGPGGSF